MGAFSHAVNEFRMMKAAVTKLPITKIAQTTLIASDLAVEICERSKYVEELKNSVTPSI